MVGHRSITQIWTKKDLFGVQAHGQELGRGSVERATLESPPVNPTILERIMQVGKKKLALDHVIVQKMDDELGEDVQSILTFGAQQLFQDEDTDRGITCSLTYS